VTNIPEMATWRWYGAVTTRIRLHIAVCPICGSSVATRAPRRLQCPYCPRAPRSRRKLWLAAGVVAGIVAVLLAR